MSLLCILASPLYSLAKIAWRWLRPRTFDITRLPDDVLFNIIRHMAASTKTPSTYQNLMNAQLVCKKWDAIAHIILYSQVELAGSNHIHLLDRSLQDRISIDQPLDVNILVAGIAEYREGVATRKTLRKLLARAPKIGKLVILHADKAADAPEKTSQELPRNVLPLPSLLDVTIMSISILTPSQTTGSLINDLPSHVKILRLPGNPAVSYSVASQPPAFQLSSLTVQTYPSTLTRWVLSTSERSLECLTVSTVDNLAELALNHPHLRSLRILSINIISTFGIQNLHNLQYLELGGQNIMHFDVQCLPGALRYIRFWVVEVAASLSNVLGSPNRQRQLPKLETIVWDYWAVGDGTERERHLLEVVCERANVSLRVYTRIDGGRRAGKGPDPTHEASLKESAFSGQNTEFAVTSLCQASHPLPRRVLSTMILEEVPISSLFRQIGLDEDSSHFRPVFEDSFHGWREWVAKLLPKIEAKRDKALTSMRRARLAVVPWLKTFGGLETAWAVSLVLASLAVFIAATVIFWGKMRHRSGGRLLVGFLAGAGIQLLQASSTFVTWGGGRPPPKDLSYTSAWSMFLCLVLTGFMAITAAPQAGREGRKTEAVLGYIAAVVIGAGSIATCWMRRIPRE